MMDPFWLSLKVAGCSTLVILLLGVPIAWVLARGRFPGKGLLAGLLTLPLVMPPTVLGYVLLRLLGRQGTLGHWLESTLGWTIVFHWTGAVLASSVAAFPLFLLPARSAIEGIDPAFEDAARLLGRGEISVFRTITVPLAWRGLVAGAVLAFARALGDFGATLMVAGNIPGSTQTASLAIYDAVNADDSSRAAQLSFLVAITSIVAVLIAQKTLPPSSEGELSEQSNTLEVRLTHQVHGGLTLLTELNLGSEIGVIFGPSGAGKSTILRLIAGLIRPDLGSIRLGTITLYDRLKKIDVRLRDRRVGLIFQDDLLFPHLNVEQNVVFGLDRWPRDEAIARLAEVTALCGIDGLLKRDPARLSGGERQRVGLARALAPRPRLLLCDEPVGALDLEARQSIIDRIKRVQRAESIPVLYVTHSTDEAIAIGDRLFLLSGGRIVAEGPPLDVLSSRFSSETIRLRNFFEATVEATDLDERATALRISGGPSLIVPKRDCSLGDRFRVVIDADEIVLARGPIGTISARNLINGIVERVISHGMEAEVLVRTGGVVWVVGVVSSAVESLGLIEGTEVRMIIKSRSCRVQPIEFP